MNSPFDDLAEEHLALLRDANDLHATVREIAQAAAGQQQSSAAQAALLREELGTFQRRLRIHFRREEEGLFPEARQMISDGAQGADVFGSFFAEEAEDDVSAHATLARQVNEMIGIADQMTEAGDQGEGAARKLLALAGIAAGLLQRHAAKEDSLIFPMMEKGLAPFQVDQIAARLQQIGSDRDLGGGPAADEGLTRLGH